jgi:hypothetical protein
MAAKSSELLRAQRNLRQAAVFYARKMDELDAPGAGEYGAELAQVEEQLYKCAREYARLAELVAEHKASERARKRKRKARVWPQRPPKGKRS